MMGVMFVGSSYKKASFTFVAVASLFSAAGARDERKCLDVGSDARDIEHPGTQWHEMVGGGRSAIRQWALVLAASGSLDSAIAAW